MQTEHKSCQDKINLLEAQLHRYEEEVERQRRRVATPRRRELDSRTKVANMKKALGTYGLKAVEAYKNSQEFATEKGALFDEAVKCLISCIWKEYPEWDLTFVNPKVVPDLITEFTREKAQEDAEMVAQELRTRCASGSEQPFTDEQLKVAGDNRLTLAQVINDSVGSIRPADDTAH